MNRGKVVRGAAQLSLLCVMATACASHTAAKNTGAAAEDRPRLYGYIMRVEMRLGLPDTVVARGAKVWTDPQSDNAVTDSTGFWQIADGLVPGPYRVLAELDGLTGKSGRFPIVRGLPPERVIVQLGDVETRWPPSISFDLLLPKKLPGVGKVRTP